MFYPASDFILGLSIPAISHNQDVTLPKPPDALNRGDRRRKCQNGITASQKRMLRSMLFLLSKKVVRKNLSFLTLTLPSLTKFELIEISNSWAEVMRQFLQELKRLLIRRGMSASIAGCTEIQDKRYKNRDEVAPHAHLVFQGRQTGGTWAVTPKMVREIWQRILSRMLGREVNCIAATRIEPIKKCVVSYMSKYMSKGGKLLEDITKTYGDILPTSWMHGTRDLRKLVIEEIIQPPPEVVDYLVKNLDALKKEGLVAWFGRLWAVKVNGEWDTEFERDDKPLDLGKKPKRLIAVSGSFKNQAAMYQVIERGLAWEIAE